MRIKLLKKCIVGKVMVALAAGTVIDAEDQEAKALISVGYAKATNADLTENPYAGAALVGIKSEYEKTDDAAAGQVVEKPDEDDAAAADKAAAKSAAKQK